MFDPGQGLPMFGAEELKTFIGQARWVAVNDYEWGMLQQKTGFTVADITSPGRRPGGDPGRGRVGDLYSRTDPGDPLRQAAGASSIRRVAGMPIALV